VKPLLEAVSLHKGFPRADDVVQVLHDCDLTIGEGESVAIMGPSGSGKSTLLNVLTGLDHPDHGSVAWRGEDLLSRKPYAISRWRRDELGFVFQFHFLMPDLTALENLLVPVRLRAEPGEADVARASALLADMGLGDRSDHLPGELSGGEQQRVAVARAFMNGPSLVMADEPFGNLDRDKGLELADLLFHRAQSTRAGLVVVTHDPGLAARADRTLVLEDGRLVLSQETVS